MLLTLLAICSVWVDITLPLTVIVAAADSMIVQHVGAVAGELMGNFLYWCLRMFVSLNLFCAE